MSVGTKHADGLSGCLTQPVSMAFTTPRRSATTKRSRSWLPLGPRRDEAPDRSRTTRRARRRDAGVPDGGSRPRRAGVARGARGRHRGRLCGSRNRRRDGVHRRRRPDSGPATPRRGRARAASPTRFFGYSDNDNLRLFLWNRGIVSYGLGVHPDLVCDADLHTYTERYLRRALFEESLGRIVPADEWTDDWFDFEAREPREWDDTPARRCGWGRRETPPNRSAVGCGAGRSRS